MIKYVSRESIAPSLGKAYPKQGIILIRDEGFPESDYVITLTVNYGYE